MQLILTTSFPRLTNKAFSALNYKIINHQIVKYRQRFADERWEIKSPFSRNYFEKSNCPWMRHHQFYYHVELVLITFYIFNQGSWDAEFPTNLRQELWTNENAPFGIGLSKNLQRGSQPSFKFQTKRFSLGTTCCTYRLCFR